MPDFDMAVNTGVVMSYPGDADLQRLKKYYQRGFVAVMSGLDCAKLQDEELCGYDKHGVSSTIYLGDVQHACIGSKCICSVRAAVGCW
jgi:hypothetical protein